MPDFEQLVSESELVPELVIVEDEDRAADHYADELDYTKEISTRIPISKNLRVQKIKKPEELINKVYNHNHSVREYVVDICLDRKDSSNRDGFKAINIIKDKDPDSNPYVISAHVESIPKTVWQKYGISDEYIFDKNAKNYATIISKIKLGMARNCEKQVEKKLQTENEGNRLLEESIVSNGTIIEDVKRKTPKKEIDKKEVKDNLNLMNYLKKNQLACIYLSKKLLSFKKDRTDIYWTCCDKSFNIVYKNDDIIEIEKELQLVVNYQPNQTISRLKIDYTNGKSHEWLLEDLTLLHNNYNNYLQGLEKNKGFECILLNIAIGQRCAQEYVKEGGDKSLAIKISSELNDTGKITTQQWLNLYYANEGLTPKEITNKLVSWTNCCFPTIIDILEGEITELGEETSKVEVNLDSRLYNWGDQQKWDASYFLKRNFQANSNFLLTIYNKQQAIESSFVEPID